MAGGADPPARQSGAPPLLGHIRLVVTPLCKTTLLAVTSLCQTTLLAVPVHSPSTARPDACQGVPTIQGTSRAYRPPDSVARPIKPTSPPFSAQYRRLSRPTPNSATRYTTLRFSSPLTDNATHSLTKDDWPMHLHQSLVNATGLLHAVLFSATTLLRAGHLARLSCTLPDAITRPSTSGHGLLLDAVRRTASRSTPSDKTVQPEPGRLPLPSQRLTHRPPLTSPRGTTSLDLTLTEVMW